VCTAPDRVPPGRCLRPLNRGTIFLAGHHTAVTMASPLGAGHPFARQRSPAITNASSALVRGSLEADPEGMHLVSLKGLNELVADLAGAPTMRPMGRMGLRSLSRGLALSNDNEEGVYSLLIA
jgi:hypothetical protein